MIGYGKCKKKKKVKIEGNIKDYLSKPTTKKQSNVGELFSASTLIDWTALHILLSNEYPGNNSLKI